MKKSELFKAAQVAVLAADFVTNKEKLEIIKLLMSEESVAVYCEEHRAKKESEEAPY